MSDIHLPRRAGRKTRAEELGLVERRRAWLKRLGKITATTTDAQLLVRFGAIADALVEGLISGGEADALLVATNGALRAARQRDARGDVLEVMAAYESLKRELASAQAAASRCSCPTRPSPPRVKPEDDE